MIAEAIFRTGDWAQYCTLAIVSAIALHLKVCDVTRITEPTDK